MTTGNHGYTGLMSEKATSLSIRALTSHNPTGLNGSASRDSLLHLMDYESACPVSPPHTRGHVSATLEEQLLSYSENAENEGEEEEYLEEEVLQVHQHITEVALFQRFVPMV